MSSENPKLFEQYSAGHTIEAKSAIVNEDIREIDVSKLPIHVDIANIDKLSNDEYIKVRRNGFGASDSAAMLGISPFTTPEELIKEKLLKHITEEERAIGELAAVKKGKDLEPLIIEKFKRFFGQECYKPPHMYRFNDYPYLTVNFDGITETSEGYAPAEMKVVTVKGERHYDFAKAIFEEGIGFKPLLPNITDANNWMVLNKAAYYGIPPYYYTQLQQQIFALNAKFGHLSVLRERTWQFYSFFIPRDESTISAEILEGYKLWEKIKAEKIKRGDTIE